MDVLILDMDGVLIVERAVELISRVFLNGKF